MRDEMKLKDNIFWNCQSNKMVGFTCGCNSLDLKSELIQFLKGDGDKPDNTNSDKEVHKAVTYVNQWRFRSIYNETRTIEFFYNSGSLPGDELMKLLFNILSMMNFIEVRILGCVSDAGGNSTRLNTLLHNGKEIGNRLWLEDEDITFQDPSTFRKTMIAT